MAIRDNQTYRLHTTDFNGVREWMISTFGEEGWYMSDNYITNPSRTSVSLIVCRDFPGNRDQLDLMVKLKWQ